MRSDFERSHQRLAGTLQWTLLKINLCGVAEVRKRIRHTFTLRRGSSFRIQRHKPAFLRGNQDDSKEHEMSLRTLACQSRHVAAP